MLDNNLASPAILWLLIQINVMLLKVLLSLEFWSDLQVARLVVQRSPGAEAGSGPQAPDLLRVVVGAAELPLLHRVRA